MSQLPNAKLLQAFEVTARHGSLTSASKELFLTQSALSRQIKTLENVLSLELFLRQKNRLVLTETGHSLYVSLSKSLREIAAHIVSIKKGLKRLTIKAPPSFSNCWLAPRLAQFYKLHPCVISLHMEENHSGRLSQNYDCEILFSPSNNLTSDMRLLFQERIQPACSPEMRETIDQEGIDSVPVLHTLYGITPLPYWDFWKNANPDSRYIPEQASVAGGMEFSMQDQAMTAAIGGLGVVMVDPNLAVKALQRGRLVALAEPIETPFCYWIVANKNGGDKTSLIDAFCRWIEDEANAS